MAKSKANQLASWEERIEKAQKLSADELKKHKRKSGTRSSKYDVIIDKLVELDKGEGFRVPVMTKGESSALRARVYKVLGKENFNVSTSGLENSDNVEVIVTRKQ